MFWTRVYVFQETPISLSNRLKDSYFFNEPKSEYLDLLRSYNKLLKFPLLEENMQELMSENLKKNIFEKIDTIPIQINGLKYAEYGASLCHDEQIFESTEILSSERDFNKFSLVLKNMEVLRSVLNTVNYNIIDMATDHSTELVQENFKLLTEITIIYAIFSICIYFGFYLPLISKELKRLEILKRFCKLI